MSKQDDPGLYVIYDRLAEECGPIFEARNHVVAVRMYKRFWEAQPAGHSDEFWLFCLGTIDKRSMEIECVKPIRLELNPAEVESDGT